MRDGGGSGLVDRAAGGEAFEREGGVDRMGFVLRDGPGRQVSRPRRALEPAGAPAAIDVEPLDRKFAEDRRAVGCHVHFDGLTPVCERIFVVDRDRLTCSGGASSAHLAAFLVDRHLGSAAAREALAIMIVDEALGPDRPQPGVPLDLHTSDPLVKRALRVMQQTMDAPLTVARLAERMRVGRRQLERRFEATLGLSPQEAGRRVRLSQVRHLLLRTSLTVSQIAAETGFADASHLIRVFRAEFGETPEAWRTRLRPGAGGVGAAAAAAADPSAARREGAAERGDGRRDDR